TLALGTITVAPSSTRERVTTSQFWPAMFFVDTPVMRQMPWFGYTTRSPTWSVPSPITGSWDLLAIERPRYRRQRRCARHSGGAHTRLYGGLPQAAPMRN